MEGDLVLFENLASKSAVEEELGDEDENRNDGPQFQGDRTHEAAKILRV